jgi:hypothetical protein
MLDVILLDRLRLIDFDGTGVRLFLGDTHLGENV